MYCLGIGEEVTEGCQNLTADIEEEIVVVMAGSGDDAKKFKSVKLVKTPAAAAKNSHVPATIRLAPQSPAAKLTPVSVDCVN